MRPIVGITTDIQLTTFGAWTEESALVPPDYTRAAERAGGGFACAAGAVCGLYAMAAGGVGV